MYRALIPAAAIALSLTGSAAAFAQVVIAVNNPSFESPTYAPGGFGPAVGWTSLSGIAGAAHAVPGTRVNSVPDGVQFAFAGDSTSPATLFQDLGLPVAPGVTYEIDIFVGSRVEGIAAQYRIELDAGSTPIGSLSGTISPGTGDFIPVTLTAIGAGTGDLGIRLSETGFGQSLFDDVRVTAFSVPEPSSLMLVAGAAVGALAATCRRARTAVRPQGGDAS